MLTFFIMFFLFWIGFFIGYRFGTFKAEQWMNNAYKYGYANATKNYVYSGRTEGNA